jgi:hypothetical protein
MKKAISVRLAKIDYDLGQPYIKLILDNPYDYTFTQCIVEVHSVSNGKWNDVKRFDISTLFEGKNNVVISLPVSALDGMSDPAIYNIYLKAINPSWEELEDRLVLSDIHGVYRHLLNSLLETNKCSDIDDALIKKYLLLYGHQAALQNKDLEIAKDYFLLMHQGFSKCGNNSKTVNCGCHD